MQYYRPNTLRVFGMDSTARSTQSAMRVASCELKARNFACSRQHAWHSCRVGCIVRKSPGAHNPSGTFIYRADRYVWKCHKIWSHLYTSSHLYTGCPTQYCTGKWSVCCLLLTKAKLQEGRNCENRSYSFHIYFLIYEGNQPQSRDFP